MQLAIGDNMFRYDAASGVNSLEVSIFYSKEFFRSVTVWSLEYSIRRCSPLGAIDELASLLWHTKYFDVGTFSLLAPIRTITAVCW